MPNSKFLFFLSLTFVIFGLLSALALESIYSKLALAHFLLAFIIIVFAVIKLFKKSKDYSESNNFKTIISSVLVLIVLVAFYIQIQKANMFWDFSAAKVYSLSEESKKILTDLSKDLKLFVIDDQNSVTRAEITRLLSLYQAESNKISYQFVSPKTGKSFRKYINPLEKNVIYFEYGPENQATVGALKKFNEVEISKAIYRLIHGSKAKIYFVLGHGEPHGDQEEEAGLSTVTKALIEQGYEFRGIVLSALEKIPEDASMLVLVAAPKPYLETEKEIIKKYLQAGGRLLVLNDPEQKNNFDFILNPLGIKIKKEIVLDQIHALHSADKIAWEILINNFKHHPITNSLIANKLPVVFTKSNPLEIPDNTKVLLSSSKASWGETNLQLLNSEKPNAAYEKGSDLVGPLIIGAAYEQDNQKLVVYSDIDWIRNANINVYGNAELFINSINWLLANDSSLEILPRYIRPSRMEPIQKSDYQTFFVLAFIIPEFFLVLLLGFWYYRKRC